MIDEDLRPSCFDKSCADRLYSRVGSWLIKFQKLLNTEAKVVNVADSECELFFK